MAEGYQHRYTSSDIKPDRGGPRGICPERLWTTAPFPSPGRRAPRERAARSGGSSCPRCWPWCWSEGCATPRRLQPPRAGLQPAALTTDRKKDHRARASHGNSKSACLTGHIMFLTPANTDSPFYELKTDQRVGHFPGRFKIWFKTWGQTFSVYFLPAIKFSKN